MPEPISDMSREAALEALEWLVAMGADEAIAADPQDRFAAAPSAPPRQPAAARAPLAPPPAAAGAGAAAAAAAPPRANPARMLAPDDAVADARSLAAACASLEDIAAALARFEACPLQRTATNLVFADGNPKARVLFIGEAPGREEDEQGKPFVGRSGQLLDEMLKAIGLSRHAEDPAKAAYITNVIYWRPPGNRKPVEAETLMCLPFLTRTIELMKPEFIVCLGATPSQRLLDTSEGILKLRGQWAKHGNIPVLATLHPAYLLRQPAQKRLAWRDMLMLRKAMD